MPTSDFTGVGIKPTLTGASATDSTTILVTFSEDMSAIGLTDPANYTLNEDVGSLARSVSSSSIVTGASPTQVSLGLNGEMTTGTSNYTIVISALLEDLAGNVMDPASLSQAFNGVGDAPTVSRVSIDPADLTALEVLFNEDVKQVSSSNSDDALNPNNYSIVGDTTVTVTGVSSVDAKTVDLSLTGLINGGSYTLTIQNVEDLSNNPIN